MRRTALALIALPLAFAACGGGKSSAPPSNLSPIAYVKSAGVKTAQASSEHATLTASASVSGQALTVTGAGDFDNTNHQGSMHANVAIAGLTATIDEVLDGTTIYMKSPLFSDGLPKGKTWLKLDLQKALATKGIDFSALASQSPAQALAQLQAAGAVTKVGEETIDGAATTHYRATIDPSKLPQGAKIEAFTHAKYGPEDIWIGNDDGYVHKISFSYSAPFQGSKQVGITMSMSFSDFGKNVAVSVPSDSESFGATNASLKGIGA